MRRHSIQTPQGSPRSRARTVSFMIAVAIGAVLAWIKPPALLTASPSAVDVLTYHNDNARTGQNLNEGILTPANVRMATFGKVGFFAVDGKVDAQPLLLSGVTIPGRGIHDVLYSRDRARHHLRPGRDHRRCALEPIAARSGGIPKRSSIRMRAGRSGDRHHLDAGHQQIGWTEWRHLRRRDVQDRVHLHPPPACARCHVGRRTVRRPADRRRIRLRSKQYEERSAILLLNRMIITSWTSHCDADPYHGWIMSYNASTLAQTSALNTTPNGSRGAYWMAGAGPAADSAGNIYLLAGNGTFDTTLDGSGFPSQGDFGNAFLKLSNSPALAVVDYFATFDTVSKSDADSDLGSGGTLVLPDLLDINHQVRHLAVGAGKDGHIYLADRDSMGRFHATPSDNSNLYQDVSGALPGGVWSMPAYFNSTLYYGPQGNTLKAFSIISAKIVPTPASQSTQILRLPWNNTRRLCFRRCERHSLGRRKRGIEPGGPARLRCAESVERVLQLESGAREPGRVRPGQQVHHTHDCQRARLCRNTHRRRSFRPPRRATHRDDRCRRTHSCDARLHPGDRQSEWRPDHHHGRVWANHQLRQHVVAAERRGGHERRRDRPADQRPAMQYPLPLPRGGDQRHRLGIRRRRDIHVRGMWIPDPDAARRFRWRWKSRIGGLPSIKRILVHAAVEHEQRHVSCATVGESRPTSRFPVTTTGTARPTSPCIGHPPGFGTLCSRARATQRILRSSGGCRQTSRFR